MLSEPHHRGMKFGFALHSIDNWVQALPAGGPESAKSEHFTVLDLPFFRLYMVVIL